MKRIGLLVAAGLVLAGCTSTTDGAGQDTTPSAPSSSSLHFPSTTAETSAPAAPTSTAPSSTSAAPQVDGDWVNHADFSTYPHPGMDCSRADGHGKVAVVHKAIGDVNSDGIPDAAVVFECVHSASEWPESVYVYTSGKRVLGSVIPQSDDLYVPSLKLAPGKLTTNLLGWSQTAAGCCPDQAFTQTFTWDGSHFVAGKRVQTSGPGSGSSHCGDGAFEITAGHTTAAGGNEALVLLFRNVLSTPCTTKGYPGLDALVGTARVVAHAKRTLNGYTGGAHSIVQLTVQPGGIVSARVEWNSMGTGCTMSDHVDTIPPDDRADTLLHLAVGSCELQVHPLVAGTSGNG